MAPLGLLYTGLVIYEHGLSNLRPQRGIPMMLLLRFVAAPGLCLAFCSLWGVTGMARGVFAMESALPTMTQSVVMAGLLGADEDYAALGAAISTLLSFAVIPFVRAARARRPPPGRSDPRGSAVRIRPARRRRWVKRSKAIFSVWYSAPPR